MRVLLDYKPKLCAQTQRRCVALVNLDIDSFHPGAFLQRAEYKCERLASVSLPSVRRIKNGERKPQALAHVYVIETYEAENPSAGPLACEDNVTYWKGRC